MRAHRLPCGIPRKCRRGKHANHDAKDLKIVALPGETRLGNTPRLAAILW
jgi:hypothetical protein